MSDPLSIQPILQPIDASLSLPGSKSITNRALILAALAEGETTLEGALFSRDTQIMVQALRQLGFRCEEDAENHRITLRGEGGHIPEKSAKIDVGNAGTAARFLTAFLALQPGGVYHLDGDDAMRQRPMAGLIEALRTLHAAAFDFHGETNHFPFTVKAQGYQGGTCTVDASASSQILSALLLAAPTGNRPVHLAAPGVRPAYIEITQKMRESFGAPLISEDPSEVFSLQPIRYCQPKGGLYPVEPDLSAASYFLALVLIHNGRITLPGIGPKPMQGDAAFAETLGHHGLQIEREQAQWLVRKDGTRKIQLEAREINFNAYSDTFLTYAAITPLLGGPVRITGIGHTRRQETDRISGMAKELSKLGQPVEEAADSLYIKPDLDALRAHAKAARSAGQLLAVETYEDHRFAMSFAILGTYDLFEDGQPWLAIKDPACCGKTYPKFFDVLQSLRHD
ncbi:MAG: 3-phosphoshikimate 1-carboxyvinyltransferase [Puniceicoccaceae bacterium MED-G30]|nr:MAG: 3-phosphoshikimate 1-carboxyvinyltransferase [Puniceicoccaceae bacterium MED-G30]